ncbi:MAG: virulence factor SrfB [Candidatus Riflebacteria bacterium]|nr:virulence factor SrfB [Candidatus Riflebacteria bacterium]
MEKIEFLASTGLTFYSPEEGYRFPDELLSKSWNYRVLQEPNSAICLELGDKPIVNAVSGDQLLKDIGGISICFGDVLRAVLGKWLPLPFKLNSQDKSIPTKSVDWARIIFTRPLLQLDDNVFKYAIAVDTNENLDPNAVGDKQGTGLLPEDIGRTFVLDSGNVFFYQTPGMLNWIKTVFVDIPSGADDAIPAYAISMASFMTLIDGLKQAELVPEMTILSPEGEDINVDLVLDLGNSRACGVLAEEIPGTDVRLDECCKMEIRNLKDPTLTYTEPFSTSFKFYPPLFEGENYKLPAVSTRFVWPGIVRIGQEAAEMEQYDIGDTGMSSPKRYLWDLEQKHYPWYFNLPIEGVGKKVDSPILASIDDDGYFSEDAVSPSFEHCYPASSMMSFVMTEILGHVYAQINSYAYRKAKGHRQAARRLRNIVLTVPCGMSTAEKNVYIKRIQNSVDLFFYLTHRSEAQKPKVHIDLDEASAVQLTYLYGEIVNHFMSDSKATIESLGRIRTTDDGLETSVFRAASIDIGGGTSDLMIAEYRNGSNHSSIIQKQLFSEGFSIAGDEITKRIIEKIILKKVFNWAREKNPDINWEDFRIFFGQGHGGKDKRFVDMKAEMCRQIWIPMSLRYLESVELDSEDPNIELNFDQFFPDRMPSSNVLDFFSEQMRSEFGVEMTLAEIPWRISKVVTNSVITNVMDNVLRIFSEVIAQFNCDVLILGGKPSSLPVIREILLRYMPVKPSGIVCLKGFSVGSWYPFSQRGGGIADPKTTCVMGATVWLYAERLKKLEAVSINSDNSMIKQRECFIGTFIKDTLIMDNEMFPTNANAANLIVSKTAALGVRRVDSNLCMVNPLWEILIDNSKLKTNGPYTVMLAQDNNDREMVKVIDLFDENSRKADKHAVSLRLKTMVAEQYWIDTGCFEL